MTTHIWVQPDVSPLPARNPQVAEGEGGAARAAEVAAELAGMDEQLMDVQEKFASLQRFEARVYAVFRPVVPT